MVTHSTPRDVSAFAIAVPDASTSVTTTARLECAAELARRTRLVERRAETGVPAAVAGLRGLGRREHGGAEHLQQLRQRCDVGGAGHLEEPRRDHPRDLRAVREHHLPAATRREVLAGEVGADRPEVLGRRHVAEGRDTPPVAESRPVRFPAPAWRETAPSTIRVAAIGDSALTVTPLGAAWPICQVSAATARFAQLYAPASAARHPEPEVTPRIRPWPAAAMIGSAARSTLRYPLRCTSSTARQSSSTPEAKPRGTADAGDVDDRVERAELVDELRRTGRGPRPRR